MLRVPALLENVSHLEHVLEFIADLVMQLEINLFSFNVFAVFIVLANLLVVLLIPPFSVDHSPVLLALVETQQIDC